MSVYLDNAATTPIAEEVFDAMVPYLTSKFGNPSSLHSEGRKARAAIESARKTIAGLLDCQPGEIIFTSGGTEANNTILTSTRAAYPTLITAPTEHHAVLEVSELLEEKGMHVELLNVDAQGHHDYNQLEVLLSRGPAVVSLMYANNETGTLAEIDRIVQLCGDRHFFHTDAVQAVAHLPLSLASSGIHALSASAHKFHGPKGTGFMFIKSGQKVHPLINGGPQEREMRAGTENVASIVGMAKAMEIAYQHMEVDIKNVQGLKQQLIELLTDEIEGVSFNGDTEGLYTILNVSLPPFPKSDLLLFNMDLKGIACSGGSACSSGAAQGSHVLEAMHVAEDRSAIRFSFSRYTTREDVTLAAKALSAIFHSAD